MVKPAVLRRAVGFVKAEFKLSLRRACRVLGFARSSMSYESKRKVPGELLEKLKALAMKRPRFGYRRLHLMLRRAGESVNHKRVYRLYREEGLSVRRKHRKRMVSAERKTVLPPPTRPNERWSMDFVSDATEAGRRFRVFTCVDDFTRKCVALEVDTSFSGERLARFLSELGGRDVLPAMLVSDNGPEFTSKAMDQWAWANKVSLHFIRPGKPVENAYCESFNGKFRDECLNTSWFADLADARQVIDAWRHDYNYERPHSSLDGRTPSEYEQIFTNPGLTQCVA